MDNSIILNYFAKLFNWIREKYLQSLVGRLISKFSDFIFTSLNNSQLISTILQHGENIFSASYLKKIISWISTLICRVLALIKENFEIPIKKSSIVIISNKLYFDLKANLVEVISIIIGTSIIINVLVRTVYGTISIKNLVFSIIIAVFFSGLAFLKVDLEGILTGSVFIKFLRRFLDFES